ncbi:MAG TPA: hypothetical protein VFL57_08540 [Bryobacteraceae bacterium]|nr:hypothetical protein [Bryobacteraceae bacterium]
MNITWIKVVFAVSGIYDSALGLAFLLFAPQIFARFGITPPNHPGYIQFPALLLIIFGVMFLQVARDPGGHRDLMLYGAALKAAYCGIAFWHELHGGIPDLWMPWAWADLVFCVAFLVAWRQTARALPASMNELK